MDIVNDLIGNRWDLFVTLVTGVVGGLLLRTLLSRRASLKYNVAHARVGVSTEDPIFGAVKISWNGNDFESLHFSTLTLKNTSMKDIEDLTLKVFAADNTNLLTQKSRFSESVEILDFTKEYKAKYLTKVGEEFTQEQISHQLKDRDFQIPVLNRGQTITINFLVNTVADEKGNQDPSIWASIQHRGVKLKYSTEPSIPNQLFSVPVVYAGWAGLPLAVVFTIISTNYFEEETAKVISALAFGLLASLPGALSLLVYRKIRDILAG